MLSFAGWVLVRKHDLTYLKGVARASSRLQRTHVRDGEWNAKLQNKNRKLHEQIRCDQAYIDDLESCLTPVQIAHARVRSKARRGAA